MVEAFGALAEEQNINHTDPDAGPLESFFSLWQHYAERGIPNTANRCPWPSALLQRPRCRRMACVLMYSEQRSRCGHAHVQRHALEALKL